jgi:hypothetical protein
MHRSHRRAIAAIVALAAMGALGVVGLAAPPASTQPTEVLKWNRIAISTLLQPPLGTLPAPAGGAPSAGQISLAMTQGAVYDAVNAIEPKHYRPYLLQRRFGATSSENAAVATAAYEVLSSIVQGVPQEIAFPNRQALLDSLTAAYNDSLDDIDDSPFKMRGIEAGHAAAEAMIAARTGDGRFGPSQWRGAPNGDLNQIPVGHWTPKLPNGTVQLDPTAWVGGVKPFLIESPSQFRTPGPNALTSAAYATEFNEVKALGGDGVATPTARTADQTRTALFWTGSGGPFWNVDETTLITQRGLDLADSARLLAMTNLAAADAVINCYNDKYYWDLWRPWTAIARAAEDGNPATTAQAGWAPLRSAPYPEHPSGHMCIDGGHVGMLRHFFGTDEVPFDATSFVITDHPNHYNRFSDALHDVENARVWTGLHFRTADLQGEQLGLNVAAYVSDHFFQPVGQP